MRKDIARLFGARVRAAREQAELTQEELGERIDRHTDTISLIERGRTLPSITTAYALADALAIPVAELLPPSEDSRSGRRVQAEFEIAELLRSLPDKQLALAHEQLKLIARLG